MISWKLMQSWNHQPLLDGLICRYSLEKNSVKKEFQEFILEYGKTCRILMVIISYKFNNHFSFHQQSFFYSCKYSYQFYLFCLFEKWSAHSIIVQHWTPYYLADIYSFERTSAYRLNLEFRYKRFRWSWLVDE